MTFIQETGIVHRDLKSANILLETILIASGESVIRAVICDFGLAKVTSVANHLENMKLSDVAGFSPRYAAPEVLAFGNQGILDTETEKKADVYSFGIIIWELLTRKIPWEGLDRFKIEQNVRSGIRVSDGIALRILCIRLNPIQ